jgi:hypothetical protein
MKVVKKDANAACVEALTRAFRKGDKALAKKIVAERLRKHQEKLDKIKNHRLPQNLFTKADKLGNDDARYPIRSLFRNHTKEIAASLDAQNQSVARKVSKDLSLEMKKYLKENVGKDKGGGIVRAVSGVVAAAAGSLPHARPVHHGGSGDGRKKKKKDSSSSSSSSSSD